MAYDIALLPVFRVGIWSALFSIVSLRSFLVSAHLCCTGWIL